LKTKTAVFFLFLWISCANSIERTQLPFFPIKDFEDFQGLIENLITYSPIIIDSIMVESSNIGIDAPALSTIEEMLENESKKLTQDFTQQNQQLEEEETPEFLYFYGVQAYLSKTVSAYYIPVGITSDEILNLKIVVKFPYIVRKVKKEDKEYQNSGFGDLAVYISRFFYLFKNSIILIPSVFMKFPTGEHKTIDKVDVSTGTGSLDYGGGITAVFIKNSNMVITAVSYTATGSYDPPDKDLIHYGDIFSSSLAYQRGFMRKNKLWVGLKLSYVKLFESISDGKGLNDDMNLIDITPYLRIRIDSDIDFIGHKFYFNIGMSIPVSTKVDPDLRVPQVSRDPIFNIGFSSIF